MGAQPSHNAATNHYTVLGISRGATAEQVKHAYRHKAKAAHPDAGGSAAAMERINAAYQVLGDPSRRADYDGFTQAAPAYNATPTARPQPYSESRPSDRDRPPTTTQHPRGARPFSTNEAEAVHRSRQAWARNSAWELFRYSLPATIAAIIGRQYFGASPGFNVVFFVPVYALTLSILFLTNPALRLVFADIVRRHPTTQHERLGALALIVAFFPLLGLWLLWQ